MSEFKVLYRMCRLLFGYRHEQAGNRVMEWAVLTFAVAAYAQYKSSLHLQKTEVQAAFDRRHGHFYFALIKKLFGAAELETD